MAHVSTAFGPVRDFGSYKTTEIGTGEMRVNHAVPL